MFKGLKDSLQFSSKLLKKTQKSLQRIGFDSNLKSARFADYNNQIKLKIDHRPNSKVDADLTVDYGKTYMSKVNKHRLSILTATKYNINRRKEQELSTTMSPLNYHLRDKQDLNRVVVEGFLRNNTVEDFTVSSRIMFPGHDLSARINHFSKDKLDTSVSVGWNKDDAVSVAVKFDKDIRKYRRRIEGS
ncbi:unnamed protein product [Mytilus edulis]|uniref:Uncharacterized protein n=1 Tax=Mytilus edulis TaxID=6550 RepID=A0A8S3TTQ4_MYTED|nr:unnamed protein product [Mytilus edulis]